MLPCFLLLSNLSCFLQLNKTLHKDIFYKFFNKLDPDPDPHSEKLLVPNPHSEKLLDPDADRHKMNVNPRD